MKPGVAAVTKPRKRIADFIALTKPRLNSLVVVTTGVGYLVGHDGEFNLFVFANTTIGTALVAGSAAAFNQVSERDLDARMVRTKRRPIPAGRLKPNEAIRLAVLLAVAGLAQITFGANPTAALVALGTLVSYTNIYTPFKRWTHWSLLVGAIPGALPVVIGWAAAKPLTAETWSLFALVFVWQLPHFLALSWIYRVDFKMSGLPLLSVIDPSGRRTASHLLIYAVLLLPVSLIPIWIDLSGKLYSVGVTISTICLIILATLFAVDRSTSRARLLFVATLVYLPVVWALLLLDTTG